MCPRMIYSHHSSTIFNPIMKLLSSKWYSIKAKLLVQTVFLLYATFHYL